MASRSERAKGGRREYWRRNLFYSGFLYFWAANNSSFFFFCFCRPLFVFYFPPPCLKIKIMPLKSKRNKRRKKKEIFIAAFILFSGFFFLFRRFLPPFLLSPKMKITNRIYYFIFLFIFGPNKSKRNNNIMAENKRRPNKIIGAQ